MPITIWGHGLREAVEGECVKPSAIPEEWIKRYVDQLLEVAGKLQPGAMQEAVLLRADHVMDLVKAWRAS